MNEQADDTVHCTNCTHYNNDDRSETQTPQSTLQHTYLTILSSRDVIIIHFHCQSIDLASITVREIQIQLDPYPFLHF